MPFFNLLMFQLLKPIFQIVPCLFPTFHLEDLRLALFNGISRLWIKVHNEKFLIEL